MAKAPHKPCLTPVFTDKFVSFIQAGAYKHRGPE